MDLALDDQRVDDPPEIVACGKVDDRDLARLEVDLGLGDVSARWVREVLRVVERGLVEAGLELVVREVVRHIGSQRHLAETLRPVGAGDAELAVLELDIGLGSFEEVGGDLSPLGDDLVHRLDDRRAADGERARPVGPHSVGDLGGIAVDNFDALHRDAEGIRDKLRECRLVPLAVAVRSGQHRDAAGRVNAHRRTLEEAGAGAERADDRRRGDAARLDISGDPDPAQLAARHRLPAAALEAMVIGRLER